MTKQIVFLGILILSLLSLSNAGQNTVSQSGATVEKWKSLENWRMLRNDMGQKSVRKILGEPERINGGVVAFWNYPNGGDVTFMDGKVSGWSEPLRWDEGSGNASSSDIDPDKLVLGILLVAILFYFTPILWVLFSSRSTGGAKFGWFLITIVFSWLGFAAFLILTQTAKARKQLESKTYGGQSE